MSQTDRAFLKKLGERVRNLRKRRGWTLEEVEEFGWPSWRHLQQIETGKKDVNATTLKRLAELYEISLSQLLRGL